ncbi:lysophospholipid acyltransferase family protein [Oceanibacterium hippocampi]|uniref:2-acyl-glycerophospho-ethanolamine acyltransferase n=1 Tax=Oceanibacterium hippocampi TaxID=745714 RepID=A0A1Y5RK28_9PROT|nr:lysophospholipid acyltransferase family protein [Oceanibacterium hippocampi]SLN19459.1 2-acyl-glycerophospho-ethanolamine acyltransferase [Oceanibacterium hippocampi]
MASIRAGIVLVLFALWTLPLIPLQALAVRFNWRLAESLPHFYHKVVCRILGVRVRNIGTVSRVRPTLFVLNHISWLDIPVISQGLPGSFVAKREVGDFPGFGTLARLQRSVFVERKRTATAGHRDEMQQRLDQGHSLILFPEGTSNDGVRVLPFRSAFLAVAEKPVSGGPLTVQPVTIAYTKLDGLPLTRGWMNVVAWVGDEELPPHLWQLLKSGRLEAELRFHQPVTIEEFGSRKALSSYCQTVIADGLTRALTGRPEPAPSFAAPARGNGEPQHS